MNLDQHLNSSYKVCRYKKLQNYLLNDKSVNSYDINSSCNASKNIIRVNLLVSFKKRLHFDAFHLINMEAHYMYCLSLTKNIFK